MVFVIFLPILVSDQQHLHRQQVDENHPLVLLTGGMTVMERVRQEVLRCKDKNRQTIIKSQSSALGSLIESLLKEAYALQFKVFGCVN